MPRRRTPHRRPRVVPMGRRGRWRRRGRRPRRLCHVTHPGSHDLAGGEPGGDRAAGGGGEGAGGHGHDCTQEPGDAEPDAWPLDVVDGGEPAGRLLGLAGATGFLRAFWCSWRSCRWPCLGPGPGLASPRPCPWPPWQALPFGLALGRGARRRPLPDGGRRIPGRAGCGRRTGRARGCRRRTGRGPDAIAEAARGGDPVAGPAGRRDAIAGPAGRRRRGARRPGAGRDRRSDRGPGAPPPPPGPGTGMRSPDRTGGRAAPASVAAGAVPTVGAVAAGIRVGPAGAGARPCGAAPFDRL